MFMSLNWFNLESAIKRVSHRIKIFQYLKLVRTLDGYGEIGFPHCSCDSRKDGHVIAIVGIKCFKLQACKEDGVPEVSTI